MGRDDYVFRYALEPQGMEAFSGLDHPTGVIKTLFSLLLEILIPCAGGEEVAVDGFRLLNDSATVHRLFEGDDGAKTARESGGTPQGGYGGTEGCPAGYQAIKNASLYEPRIELIKKYLENILSLVELESRGEIVKVDGFRLKNLQDWVGPSACDPSEVFEHAGTRCNCDCVFCYNKGAPPSLALQSPSRPAAEEVAEVETRLQYFNPTGRSSLFPSLGSTCEVLAHPGVMEILMPLRLKTDRLFRIATNGAALTPRTIDRLASLEPVYLDLSLNSTSPARRGRLMRDRRPQTAIEALPLLKSAGIPYSVVIVPWPLDTEKEMLDDLETTVAYAVAHDVHLVQISLPGYSRFFSSNQMFDRAEIWSDVVSRVRELRVRYDCPIVVMPGMYEENLSREQKNIPEVIGVVKKSPADLAGIRPGDIIRRLGGSAVRNRPQARDMLSLLQRSEMKSVSTTVARAGRDVDLNVCLDRYDYPYTKAADTHLGVVFMGTGLRTAHLERLGKMIREHRARNVLFLSSELVRPTFEQCLRESSCLADATLEIEVPENRFFGGNIFMGDLLVVEDFISCIEDYIAKRGRKPDLVVIPSSPFNLSGWGRDLTGRCYRDIARKTGVRVEILECNTIYD